MPEDDPEFWDPILEEVHGIVTAERPRPRDLVAGATLFLSLRSRSLELLLEALQTERTDG